MNQSTNLVSSQEFLHFDSVLKKEFILTNIIASFYPEEKERILLCAHWDTRPWADQDSAVGNRNQPIWGANDGASGVAVLLELAHIISREKSKYGVDIVFFDGEDSGIKGNTKSYCLGSTFFAKNLPVPRPKFGILLDMVGDKDLNIYREQYSNTYAPEIVNLIWNKARKLKLKAFYSEVRHPVWDDHMPLILAGIPTVDIIDLDYPYWHTLQDTPDKCSPQSLETVGKLLISILYD
ncbi:MAG TPA: M28 family peptidase [candidate division Zixibacteria bacterium]|nr:M28 family peptidase [candidate division Zixibacteria bacterium]